MTQLEIIKKKKQIIKLATELKGQQLDLIVAVGDGNEGTMTVYGCDGFIDRTIDVLIRTMNERRSREVAINPKNIN